MDNWAMPGVGRPKRRPLGGGADVEVELEERTARSALWFESTVVVVVWQGLIALVGVGKLFPRT